MSKKEKQITKEGIIKDFFANVEGILPNEYKIGETYYKKKWSKNSNSFVKNSDDYKNEIIKMTNEKSHEGIIEYCNKMISDIFKIDKDLIEKVIKGKGNEWSKIRTLHSSSLCGLLHFNKINQDTSITFPQGTFEGINDELKFNNVDFEIENECVDKNHPASIDVLLSNKEYILFLELKFSEYLDSTDVEISNNYIKKLNSIFGLELEEINGSSNSIVENTFKLNIKPKITLSCNSKEYNDRFYIGGIKQMISHYIGISNFINKGKDKNEKIERGRRGILYAEMVFDFSNHFNDEESNKFVTNRFNNFNKAYKSVVNKINNKIDKDKVIFANEVLTYQKIFGDIEENKKLLTDEVKKFYRYK